VVYEHHRRTPPGRSTPARSASSTMPCSG
jgi:hypothetical protein